MLGKLIKHDLNYGKKPFLLMAGIAFVLLLVAGVGLVFNLSSLGVIYIVLSSILLLVMLVMTPVLIFNGYKKSLFETHGYLFLTLPVSRNKLLLSKTLGGLIWFNLNALLSIFLGLGIFVIESSLQANASAVNLANTASIEVNGWELIGLGIYGWFFVNLLVVLGFIVIFMSLTLGNSSFKSKRVHWSLAGIFGLLYFIFYLTGAIILSLGMIKLTLYSLVAVAVGYYFTLSLLKKRVELE